MFWLILLYMIRGLCWKELMVILTYKRFNPLQSFSIPHQTEQSLKGGKTNQSPLVLSMRQSLKLTAQRLLVHQQAVTNQAQ